MSEIMSIYNGSVITISILIFLLGAVAVKSARSGGARAFIVISACLAYTALFVGPLQLLSYAKPTSMEWVNRNVEEAEVLHAELREGEGIFLLLDWYGTPRYYKIPWDAELAQELIEAMEQARGEAGGGQRPGSNPPSERPSDFEAEAEQGMLDQLLGPQGDNEGDGTEPLVAPQSMGSMSAPQGQGQSEMQNAGNGKVMMRRPFSGGEVASDGENDDGTEEGEGPSAGYNDTKSEAMFWAKPQPRYQEKVAPTDNPGVIRSFGEEEPH